MCEEAGSKTFSVWERLIVLAAIWVCAALIWFVLPKAGPILALAGLASALLLLGWAFPAQGRRAAEFCFRFRWPLALLVFCLCVCLRLHGSSIGIYDEILPTQIEPGETTILGKPRWIRSDEFGVATMKYLSQRANGYGLYSRQMSLSPTNMVLDYYSPAWDWTALGKPLNWGFLLFGSEIGLSWYWCMEILLLFMTAWEMCLILTRGQRHTSLMGAALIALHPNGPRAQDPHADRVRVRDGGGHTILFRGADHADDLFEEPSGLRVSDAPRDGGGKTPGRNAETAQLRAAADGSSRRKTPGGRSDRMNAA